jgi:hypothetical protein
MDRFQQVDTEAELPRQAVPKQEFGNKGKEVSRVGEESAATSSESD